MGETLINTPAKGTHLFFKRSVIVWSVSEQNIDIIKLKSLQTGAASFNYMFSRKTKIIDAVEMSQAFFRLLLLGSEPVGRPVTPVDFGSDDVVFSLNAKFPKSVSEPDVTLSHHVVLRGVKEVNTSFPAGLDRLTDELLTLFIRKNLVKPGSVAQY